MGLFSAKKTIYVSSTVYNMAGEEKERINFLKTMVISSVMGNSNFSFGDVINRNYINGPGIKARSFHRWALNNYGNIGVPTLNLNSSFSLDLVTIATAIPVAVGQTAEATYARIGPADAMYWAEQWIMENQPGDIGLEWTAAFSDITDNITITWPDTSTDVFTPANFDAEARYLYVAYALKTPSSFLGSKLFIYKMGDGDAYLDGLDDSVTDTGYVLPFIPVRIKNKFLSTTNQPAAYALAKKAYTKATGTRGKKGFDKLVTLIKDNESIDDIDHAYMVYSVSLNCVDNSARKYLFKFFDFLRAAQPYNAAQMQQWEDDQASYETAIDAFTTSREALTEAERGGATDPATTGAIPAAPTAPVTSIRFKNTGPFDTQLEQVITWNTIKKKTGAGLSKPDAKIGKLYWKDTIVRGSNATTVILGAPVKLDTDRSTIELVWQKSATKWESIEITGMMYQNLIYKGNAVEITAAEALADVEESGFLVPLHYETLKRMSLVDSTQMMTAAQFLVFNAYQVVKQKWYETTWFKILIFIVIIVLVILYPPSIGLLGPAATVGATLGFVGLTAVIVGAVANALAAMILCSIIAKVSVAVFGPKLGAIIAVIASMIALNVGQAISSGASMASMWGNMMSAANIIQMTSAVGSGIGNYMKASAMETIGKMEEMQAEYDKRTEEITNMMLKEFGHGDFHFNPMNFTDVDNGSLQESPSMFLDRTLLTGSDIAEMTVDMLHGFTEATLSLDAIGR